MGKKTEIVNVEARADVWNVMDNIDDFIRNCDYELDTFAKLLKDNYKMIERMSETAQMKLAYYIVKRLFPLHGLSYYSSARISEAIMDFETVDIDADETFQEAYDAIVDWHDLFHELEKQVMNSYVSYSELVAKGYIRR